MPWWRYPFVWLVIAGPAAVVVAGFVTAFIAVNVGVLAVTIVLSTSAATVGLGLGLFGVLSIIRLRSDELGQHGIQVNAIAPGYFATRITEGTRANEGANRRILEHTPAGRWGDVADLMGATVFLASRASDFVSGHVLTVDGGYRVR